MGGPSQIGHGVTTVEKPRDESAVVLALAATADSIATVLEDLARTRDRLAEISRADPGPLRLSAQRARATAAAERREAERLHRAAFAAEAPTAGPPPGRRPGSSDTSGSGGRDRPRSVPGDESQGAGTHPPEPVTLPARVLTAGEVPE